MARWTPHSCPAFVRPLNNEHSGRGRNHRRDPRRRLRELRLRATVVKFHLKREDVCSEVDGIISVGSFTKWRWTDRSS